MKFLFLLWIAMEASLTLPSGQPLPGAYFTPLAPFPGCNVFGSSLAIHFIGNLSFVKYIRTHTREDCFSYIRRESKLIGLSIISAPILSILPTVGVIVLLSLLQVWTNLETHWLHTWLLVTCLVYNLLQGARSAKNGTPSKQSAISEVLGASGKRESDSGCPYRGQGCSGTATSRRLDWLPETPGQELLDHHRRPPQAPVPVRVIDV